jgi:hypothetical protein
MITVDNAVATYCDDIQRAGDLCRSESQAAVSDGGFKPSLSLPPLDDRLEHFFSPSTKLVRSSIIGGSQKGRVLVTGVLLADPA